MKQTTRKGVVLGDFSPVNRAQIHMIEFARHYIGDGQLTIVVDEHAQDTIPVSQRVAWLNELFPGVAVKRIRSATWHKSDDADYSPSLVKGLGRLLGKQGHVFCLEARGKLIAAELGAAFIPVDPTLIGFSASEKEIRKNPLKHWDDLPPCVRPYYVRRVCVFGPESTGKSTLAKQLAERFGSVAVPEYAKTYIEAQGKEIDADDMLKIARGQCASEDAMAREAKNGVLFCDSDLVTSIIWSGRLVGEVPEWLRLEADKRHYDLYLLTHYDVPWVDDVHRYIPKESPAFFDRCVLELESRERNFVEIKGGWDERLELAVKAVQAMLSA
jgi:HTH-type transcriptional repressor of NAD biosynthesis genes